MEKFYTVKEIADLLGVSKPTIQRYINAAALEADREIKQRRYYGASKTVEIIQNITPDFDLAAIGLEELPQSAATECDNSPNEPPQSATEPATECQTPPQNATEPATECQTPPQSAEVEILKSVIATIQEQLTIKDKQIANMDRQIAAYEEQIADYSKRLKEAMELTKGQQLISAEDKMMQLMDKDAAEREEVITPAAEEENNAAAVPVEEKQQAKTFIQRVLDIFR